MLSSRPFVSLALRPLPSLTARNLVRAFATDSRPSSLQSTESSGVRPRRALFYIPGSDERKLKSSLKSNADCLVYDLEDGVAFNRKGAARGMILDALEAVKDRRERAVRINAVGSGLELDDLNVVLHSKSLQAIVIPKVQSAKDVQFVSQMIDTVAPEVTRRNIRLIASIESALAIMNLKEIATSDPRLDALIFAAEDYCADTGITRSPHRTELLFARGAVVNAAVAFGLQAIDLVCFDYQDDAILEEECREGRGMGFSGKQAIHPRQIDTIQKMFLPDQADLERAVRIVEGYEQHSVKGIGAFALDGKVVDLPVVKWAERLIAKAKAAEMPIASSSSSSTASASPSSSNPSASSDTSASKK
ncbi:uncharacterized protein VTP21DRAFT_872 [Calcarisporiella thermophila]|uniref:uncharacterized protein n=1 Tax=Calcarisporiella thermophila TaxID=911321 RepID=UPI003744A87B